MIKPNKNEISHVLKLPSYKRYEYFVKKVVDTENIWGLYDNGWALVGDDKGNTYLPLWPFQEFAELNAQTNWQSYKPKSIDLSYFLKEFIQEMQKNNILPCVFLTLENFGMCPYYEELVRDLEREASLY